MPGTVRALARPVEAAGLTPAPRSASGRNRVRCGLCSVLVVALWDGVCLSCQCQEPLFDADAGPS